MTVDFVQALRDIEKEKDIPLETLGKIIEVALVSAYKRHYGSTGEIHVEIDWDESRASIYTRKLVVDEVENPHVEMSIDEAKRLDPGIEVGESLDIEVTPENFGRIAAQTAKQVVVQKIREAERAIIFEEFSERAGEVVTGVVQRREGRSVLVNLGKVEALLPPSEQMPLDTYRFGERIKVFVVDVKETTKAPVVTVSRSHPGLLRRLFELEVPEIHDGVVEIKAVAREAGVRSKVAVASRQENVDPVGACVGHRGSRVQAVVDELRNEKIDIVRWSDEMPQYLASALSPAKVSQVFADESNKTATVIVPDNQLSLAIGKEGQNVRLAARLTGWRIDIRSEAQAREAAAQAQEREAAAIQHEREVAAQEAQEAQAEQPAPAEEQEPEAPVEAAAPAAAEEQQPEAPVEAAAPATAEEQQPEAAAPEAAPEQPVAAAAAVDTPGQGEQDAQA